jgi:hypothetical protein
MLCSCWSAQAWGSERPGRGKRRMLLAKDVFVLICVFQYSSNDKTRALVTTAFRTRDASLPWKRSSNEWTSYLLLGLGISSNDHYSSNIQCYNNSSVMVGSWCSQGYLHGVACNLTQLNYMLSSASSRTMSRNDLPVCSNGYNRVTVDQLINSNAGTALLLVVNYNNYK